MPKPLRRAPTAAQAAPAFGPRDCRTRWVKDVKNLRKHNSERGVRQVLYYCSPAVLYQNKTKWVPENKEVRWASVRIYVRGLASLILPRHQPRRGIWVLATPQHDAVHLARNAHTHDPGPETLRDHSQGSTQGL